MSLLALILDARPAYLRTTPLSLLQLPMGAGSLLAHLMDGLRDVGDCELAVLTDFDADDSYRDFVQQATASADGQVLEMPALSEHLAQREPSDWVLVIDPVAHALSDLPLRRFANDARRGRQIAHLVAAAPSPPVAHDRILTDARGLVRRIQRYYAGSTQVQRHAVICSILPATVLHALDDEPMHSLPALRETLVRQGLPSRDISLPGGVIDLSSESGLLQCMEWHVARHSNRRNGNGHKPAESDRRGNGNGASNKYGPVVVEPGGVVEDGAIVIGPAVIGRDARVAAGSVLVHGVVAPGVTVPAGMVVHRRLVTRATLDQGAPTDGLAGEVADSSGVWRLDRAAQRTDSAARPRRYIGVKRVAESLLAAAGLAVLSPLLAAVAVLVKLTSRGPVFFAHQREGLGGREFRCWKFRTMVSNAHAMQRKLYANNQVDGPQFKMDRDPRITPIGQFLRSSNIDELPQLFNVLLGQMSLIGPRPSPFRENQICVPWRQARLSVRPGITGLWQVCRHERSAGDFHQWIHYDMLYVRHLSWWLDVKIVLFTFLTLGGRWSVPLRWLVPDDSGTYAAEAAGSAVVPILEQPDEATTDARATSPAV